jgi:soluble lytic murein transglycosylase
MLRRIFPAIRPMLWGIFLTFIFISLPLSKIIISMYQNRFDELILMAAGENGCDPSLIKAVVWRESKFKASARGKAGEIGLMQIMPNVAEEWAQNRGYSNFKSEDLLKPEMNLRIGAWYLSKAFQQWSQASQPAPLALAQYNAGRSNVLKWVDANSLADEEHFIGRIGFASTRIYVREILKRYQFYRETSEF